SFSGSSISYGSQQQSTEQENQGTGSVASTVGAISGNVSITAGQTYTQVGSDVMAPGGDITIAAQDVQITEARETHRSEIEQKFEQSGITLAVSTPMLTAMQTITSQMEAAGDTKDGRMQGLAAANSAFAVNNALNDVKKGQSKPDATAAQQAGGVNFSLSFGSSSSESKSLQTSDTARGSSLAASGNVSITASGAGEHSNILIQGSEVSAGGNATLNAEGDVNLLAAQKTASLSGSNKSDSGSVGISFGTGGFGVSASASSARGKEAGDDLVHSNTHITAGNVVHIQSGGDTTLQGALVKAETIQAEVGGSLLIESLQDTSTYDSQHKSASASVTIGVGASGSFSASKSNVNSDFASVAEQSGFKAGDGGFQVNVQGNTDLIGGAITSNQAAVEQGKNSFTTGGTLSLSDVQNKAEYSASSTSVGVGGGSDGKKKGMTGVGVGVGSDSGNASSTTTAGISSIAGDVAMRSTDAETGIARIFEKERVQKEIDAQVKITEMFGREASKAIGDHAAVQMKQAGNLRAQASAETDPDKRAQLNAQADQLEAAWG
ncbi:hemagglutinin repeat-containing protein, partial [Hydrogenophaga sp.]|uniref:hemagglutinin repeat-containing protein n=1 Tax=Hydrogenophaga sp. TaxID=1904254 RepID=UPI002FCAA0FE